MLAETIERWNEMARAFVWGAPMLVLLIGTGVYFTAKTHLFQLRHMGLWLRKTLFSCFYRRGTPQKQRGRVALWGDVHRSRRDGRHGQHRGCGDRPDHWRAGRGVLDVDLRLFRHDDRVCGEHTRHAVP